MLLKMPVGYWLADFQCLLTMSQNPVTVKAVVHNLIRRRYIHNHHGLIDGDGTDHQVVRGAWRNGNVMADIGNIRGGNYATKAGKKQRIYLKHRSEVGAVP